jgi:hypothetical protein
VKLEISISGNAQKPLSGHRVIDAGHAILEQKDEIILILSK